MPQTTSAGSRDARLFRSRLYRLLFDKDLEEFGVTAICLNDTGNRFADGFQDDYSEYERQQKQERTLRLRGSQMEAPDRVLL